MKNLDSILQEVVSLTTTVRSFIKKESENFDKSSIEHKGFNDLVSYVDKEAEKQLVAGCKNILPEAGFITEEGTESTRHEDYNWIIDPLDGTTNFTHGLPIFAISLALMFRDQIVLGVVHEVNRDECFYAIDGSEAYCNDQVIKVSETLELKDSLLATGFPYYNFEKMPKYLKILDSLMQSTHGLRRMGSCSGRSGLCCLWQV